MKKHDEHASSQPGSAHCIPGNRAGVDGDYGSEGLIASGVSDGHGAKTDILARDHL